LKITKYEVLRTASTEKYTVENGLKTYIFAICKLLLNTEKTQKMPRFWAKTNKKPVEEVPTGLKSLE
jgi:hypothetical protein